MGIYYIVIAVLVLLYAILLMLTALDILKGRKATLAATVYVLLVVIMARVFIK